MSKLIMCKLIMSICIDVPEIHIVLKMTFQKNLKQLLYYKYLKCNSSAPVSDIFITFGVWTEIGLLELHLATIGTLTSDNIPTVDWVNVYPWHHPFAHSLCLPEPCTDRAAHGPGLNFDKKTGQAGPGLKFSGPGRILSARPSLYY